MKNKINHVLYDLIANDIRSYGRSVGKLIVINPTSRNWRFEMESKEDEFPMISTPLNLAKNEEDICMLSHEYGHFKSFILGIETEKWSALNNEVINKPIYRNLPGKCILFIQEIVAWYWGALLLIKYDFKNWKLFLMTFFKCIWSYFIGYFWNNKK